MVAQFTFIAFTDGSRSIPDYVRGPEFGGGVYVTVKGAFNPVIWNRQVAERLDALLIAFGREFDRDPNLEAVNLPETSTSASLDRTPQEGVEAYTDAVYFEALKRCMTTLRHAFPNTVVIQYTNFPTKLLPQLTDYEKEIGVGLGLPDVYPRPDAVNNPEGIYRLRQTRRHRADGRSGAAINDAVAYKKRSALKRGQTMMNGVPIVIVPEDEVPIPVREHLQLARRSSSSTDPVLGRQP